MSAELRKLLLGRYLEHRAAADVKASGSTLVGNSIEITGGVPDETPHWVRTVGRFIEDVQHFHFAGRIQLEYRSVIRIRIQTLRFSIEVSFRVHNQVSNGAASVLSIRERIKDRKLAIGLNCEQSSAAIIAVTVTAVKSRAIEVSSAVHDQPSV